MTKPAMKLGDSIVNTHHPEWGPFQITGIDDSGGWFEIHAPQGDRVLFYDEASRFWALDLN